MSDSNPQALFSYVAGRLNRFRLAYLHIIEPSVKGNVLDRPRGRPLCGGALQKIFKGKIIAAGASNQIAKTIVEQGDADLVAFGRGSSANPDLPERIRLGFRSTIPTAPVLPPRCHGYTDYSFYDLYDAA